MGISYDAFTEAFLGKVTEYNYIRLDKSITLKIIEGYMKRACAQFNRVCHYDLSDRDEENKVFNIDIPNDKLDEIIDIVSEGMVVQWLKPYAYKSENLENVLNTPDYSSYSPAELLYRIKQEYQQAQRDFRNMVVEYSYNHALDNGELGNLSQ